MKTIHQDLLNSGRDSDANLLDLSQQVQRIQRNVHDHINPSFRNLIDRPSTGKLIPITDDDHWICTVPRHADLEEIIAELERKLDEQRRELADMKHENRRLERSLVKKSIKIDALDLAGSRKRSKSIVDSIETENLQVKTVFRNKIPMLFSSSQDDVYVLEQQLIRKQREIALAQEQLREMAILSHNVNCRVKFFVYVHGIV